MKERTMHTVTESVSIAVSPDVVFDLLAEPERAVTFIPGLSRISNVANGAQGATAWDFEFNWLGLMVAGRSELTAAERPGRYQFKTVTGNRSTWTYRCDSEPGGTRLTLEVEYDVPQNQLARFASEGVLRTMNQNTVREIVANVKALLEP